MFDKYKTLMNYIANLTTYCSLRPKTCNYILNLLLMNYIRIIVENIIKCVILSLLYYKLVTD